MILILFSKHRNYEQKSNALTIFEKLFMLVY